jgi:hypothetical protein
MKKLLLLSLLITTNLYAKDLYLSCKGSVGVGTTIWENINRKYEPHTLFNNFEDVRLGVSIKNNQIHISGDGDQYFLVKNMKLCKFEDVIYFDDVDCNVAKYTDGAERRIEFTTGEYARITQELTLSSTEEFSRYAGEKKDMHLPSHEKRVSGEFKCKEVNLH